jgi:hypothetical protein
LAATGYRDLTDHDPDMIRQIMGKRWYDPSNPGIFGWYDPSNQVKVGV